MNLKTREKLQEAFKYISEIKFNLQYMIKLIDVTGIEFVKKGRMILKLKREIIDKVLIEESF